MFEYLLLVVGTSLIALAIYVEIHHRIIWETSNKNYKLKKNASLKEKLNAPNKTAYKLNIYLIWPLVTIIGASMIVFALAEIAS